MTSQMRRLSASADSTAAKQARGKATAGAVRSKHTVVLMRHGESVWNMENKFTGWCGTTTTAAAAAADAAATTTQVDESTAPPTHVEHQRITCSPRAVAVRPQRREHRLPPRSSPQPMWRPDPRH